MLYYHFSTCEYCLGSCTFPENWMVLVNKIKNYMIVYIFTRAILKNNFICQVIKVLKIGKCQNIKSFITRNLMILSKIVHERIFIILRRLDFCRCYQTLKSLSFPLS